MDRYLVISGDGHAGLSPEKYRDYLDPKYHAQFDERLPREIAMREAMEKKLLISDFNTKWRADCGNEFSASGTTTFATRCSMATASPPRFFSPTASPSATRRPSARCRPALPRRRPRASLGGRAGA